MFKNLRVYRFPNDLFGGVHSASNLFGLLDEHLGKHPFRGCGPLDRASAGFVPPGMAFGDEAFVRPVMDFGMLAWVTEEKVMPAAAIRELVELQCDAIEDAEGKRPGGRRRREIMDAVIVERLPTAFTVKKTTLAYIDAAWGWLVMDTSSASRADAVNAALRSACGSWPVRPLAVAEWPEMVMTRWLESERPFPETLAIGESAKLAATAGPARAGVKASDLESAGFLALLADGMDVQELELDWADRLRFSLSADLVVRRLKFLDLAALEFEGVEEPSARFDADLALMAGTLRELLDELPGWFGGAKE